MYGTHAYIVLFASTLLAPPSHGNKMNNICLFGCVYILYLS